MIDDSTPSDRFPAVTHDVSEWRTVYAAKATEAANLTASITAGSPYFQVIELQSINVTWQVVGQGELPAGQSHTPPGKVKQYTVAGVSDGVRPLPVQSGQLVALAVSVEVPHGASLPPGPFTGTAVIRGYREPVSVHLECVYQPDVRKFIKVVQQTLTKNVVGYAGVIGTAAGFHTFHGGNARTTADAKVAVPFEVTTPCGIASVSKLLTALAAVQLLDGVPGLNLDSPMYKALPADWKIQDPQVQGITFRELLTHTSGLPRDNPVGSLDYASLQKFICQTKVLGPASNSSPPRYPVAYSNLGFALFRILLPIVHSIKAPPGSHPWKDNPNLPPDERAQLFADEYEAIIVANVFGRVGVTGPCTGTPGGHSYAFGYTFPGTSHGIDQSPEKQQLQAGPGAWFVSINQITPVLASLSSIDGKILTADQWNHMQSIDVPPGYEKLGNGLGIDELTDSGTGGTGYRWVEKNGGYENQTASVAFFGSMVPDRNAQGPFYAALFVNSDISGGPGSVASWHQCTKCDTLFYPSNGGVCPATGTAKGPHSNWGEYILNTKQVPGGQSNWRRCSNCGALCHAASSTEPSSCPAAGGGRHVPAGQTFIVAATNQSDLVHQTLWRWCKNCGVLAYSFGNASAGVCAYEGKAGPHEFVLSDDIYSLQQPIGPDVVLLQAFRESI
jgi:hypothetical protein